jgi:hypothetical protein
MGLIDMEQLKSKRFKAAIPRMEKHSDIDNLAATLKARAEWVRKISYHIRSKIANGDYEIIDKIPSIRRPERRGDRSHRERSNGE